MKIEQIKVDMNNILQLAQRDDVYVVKYSKQTTARQSKKPFPYGLSFTQLSAKFTLAELFQILEDKEVAVVKVERG